jgi:hypothetical protein
MLGAMYPARYDPLLGYAPTPGVHDLSGAVATIDARGLRENGGPAPPPGPSILAVGDSFTFGDEVGDGSTCRPRSSAGSAAACGTAASSATASTRSRCAPSSSPGSSLRTRWS